MKLSENILFLLQSKGRLVSYIREDLGLPCRNSDLFTRPLVMKKRTATQLRKYSQKKCVIILKFRPQIDLKEFGALC